MEIELINENNRELANQFLLDNCFTSDISIRERNVDYKKLDGYVLLENNAVIGLITYLFINNVCEIISLNSKRENIGIGSELLRKVESKAFEENCKSVRIVLTNDNLRALQFCQKRGFCLAKLYPKIIDDIRIQKPDIPKLGRNDIPLNDEIELEKIISNNNENNIVRIEKNKEDYMNLLLEADPEEGVVKKYLQHGDMYVYLADEVPVAEIVIAKVDDDICELKNIATLPTERGKGYADKLIKYVFNEYKGIYSKIIVGTTENMIPFYVQQGFNRYYKTAKNFFVDNYQEDIWDGDLHCIDMYYYYKKL